MSDENDDTLEDQEVDPATVTVTLEVHNGKLGSTSTDPAQKES